jgi:DNA-binding NtrC family response regulator
LQRAPWGGARTRTGTINSYSAGSQRRTLSAEDKARLHIFFVDDERALGESCASVLQHQGYRVTTCRHAREAVEMLKRTQFDILVVDLYLTPISGVEVLKEALKANRQIVPIMITGNPSLESSLEAMRAGAWDYLPKPFSATHLEIVIGRAACAALASREAYESPRLVQHAENGPGADPIVLGNSSVFRKVIELASKVAATDASVFITGESGTGKEMIAQFIHRQSRRAGQAMVAVNCAALPEQLLESEMFGHCKGAFTGAVRDKPGLLETANGGTMFLDELIEMPKPLQAKLLRVIQDGVVRRVGSETTDATVSVRFIAATNQDPEAAVKAGLLREDLYYRLRVVPIHVPPLRKRPEETAILATHFLTQYWARHRGREQPARLGESALRALRGHPWRGNVRELQNIIEHAVVLAKPGSEIQAAELPFAENERPADPPVVVASDGDFQESYYVSRDRLLAEFERRYLVRLVNRAEGNLCRAARIGGIDRTTLYRLMKEHGIQRRAVPAIE